MPFLPLLRLLSWFALVRWAVTIVYLSSMSGKQLQPFMLGFSGWDKIAHAIAYCVGAMLLSTALRLNTGRSWRAIIPIAILTISFFGATDEWHQLHTPQRAGGSVGDWLADTLGAAVGAVAIYSLHGRYQRQAQPAPAGN